MGFPILAKRYCVKRCAEGCPRLRIFKKAATGPVPLKHGEVYIPCGTECCNKTTHYVTYRLANCKSLGGGAANFTLFEGTSNGVSSVLKKR